MKQPQYQPGHKEVDAMGGELKLSDHGIVSYALVGACIMLAVLLMCQLVLCRNLSTAVCCD